MLEIDLGGTLAGQFFNQILSAMIFSPVTDARGRPASVAGRASYGAAAGGDDCSRAAVVSGSGNR